MASIRRLLHLLPGPCLLITAILVLLCQPAHAHSAQRSQPLAHLSPVFGVTINTPDHVVSPHDSFSLSIEIPTSSHYNNIARRWVALSDPNAASKFRTLASYFPFLKQRLFHTSQEGDGEYENYFKPASSSELPQFTWADGSPVKNPTASAALASEKLLYYLTKNATALEYPEDTQVFKITLQPNIELSDTSSNVYTIDKHGNMVPHPDFAQNTAKVYKGIAYRQIVSLNPSTGYPIRTFKKVGWARFVVVEDGETPIVEGTWKVDDEEGLGIPASIYHINSRSTYKAMVRADSATPETEARIMEEESGLLGAVEAEYGYNATRMVVWRDADMTPTMYQNLDILSDNYKDPQLNLLEEWAKRERRENDGDDDFDDPDFLFKYQSDYLKFRYNEDKSQGMHTLFDKRSGDANDTGSQGFSSGLNLASTVGQTAGCPTRRMIALVGLAADCSMLASFNGTSATREWLISMVNTASQIYETQLNVTLGISALVLVNDTTCPSSSDSGSSTPWSYSCNASTGSAMSDRLALFSQWRGERANDGIAAWTLMTACTQSSVVGLSWMGMLCSGGSQSSSVAGTNVVARTQVGWRVYAHELGHTFGAVHDCTSSACADNLQASSQCCPLSAGTCDAAGAYVMNPASSAAQDQFSQCTVGNICGALGRNSVNSTCLTSNTGVHLVTSNECGNGIVEEGEECDCGGVDGCAGNNCCDPTTCKFKSGAECDDANEECCSSCRFQSSDTVCRASTGPCDYNITCPGNSSVCPTARYRETGTSCTLSNSSFSNLECISGHCTSRDLQCVTLLGNTTLYLNGNVVNVTRACTDDSSCRLSCVDPSLGSTCIITSQNFLDGTPCRGSGRCSRGICLGGSGGGGGGGGGFFNDPGSWVSRNKGTVIAIAVSIGAVIILMIIASVFRRWLHNYRQRRMMDAAGISGRPKPPQGPYSVPPAYPMAGIYTQRATHPPPPPPPSHSARSAAAASPWGTGAGSYSNYNYGGSTPAGYYPDAPAPAAAAPATAAPSGSGYQSYEMDTLGQQQQQQGYYGNSSYGNSSYGNSSYGNSSYGNSESSPYAQQPHNPYTSGPSPSVTNTNASTNNPFASAAQLSDFVPPPHPPPPRYS